MGGESMGRIREHAKKTKHRMPSGKNKDQKSQAGKRRGSISMERTKTRGRLEVRKR